MEIGYAHVTTVPLKHLVHQSHPVALKHELNLIKYMNVCLPFSMLLLVLFSLTISLSFTMHNFLSLETILHVKHMQMPIV